MSEFQQPPRLPPEDYLRPRLARLQTETFPRAAQLWDEVGSGFVFIEARLYLPETQASRAAWALYDLDRESRRAARVVAGRAALEPTLWEEPPTISEVEAARRATPRSLLRPTRIEYGGFRLIRADPGSTEFLLDAYGVLAMILLSNPVQFILTLKSVLGWPTRVVLRHWSRGQHSEPVVRELDGDFSFEEGDLRVGAHLPPGSFLRLRYRRGDGSELELELETPAETAR